MYTFLFKLVFLTLGVLGSDVFETAFKWNYINFTYPSPSDLFKSNFEPGTYSIFGIDVYKKTNSIFLTLPRTNRKARVTLARLSLSAKKENPLLTPFPSWEMNRGDNCFKLQDVSNLEIDTQGIMWVLDAKRNNKDITTCPARIVLFDLKNGGRFLGNFIIPEEFCSWKSYCVVNDIVMDGNFAYMAYVSNNIPGIMVLNKSTGKFWEVDRTESLSEEFMNYKGSKIFEWLALSSPSKNRSLYIVPQVGDFIFKIPTKVLQNEKLSSNGHVFMERDIKKFVPTAAAIGDSEGDVYFGYNKNNSVFVREAHTAHIHLVDRNPRIINNIGTFAFDNSGYMYMTSSRNDVFDSNTKGNTNEINFRVLKVRTGSKSYQYPNLLKQTAGHRHLHVEDLIHEKDNLKKHQDALRKHIEDEKKRIQEEQERIRRMEQLHRDEHKKLLDEEKRKQREEQNRKRDEEKHQKEQENRHREEERRRAREEQERRKHEEQHKKELEHRRREEEKRREREEQKHRQEEEKRHREEEKRRNDDERKRREEEARREREEQQRLREEENRHKEELRRQHEEEKRKQREEEQKRKEEQKRLEEDNERRRKHQRDHEIDDQHHPHHHHQHPHPTEYTTRHQTVRVTKPQYPTTNHHTVQHTRPQYPTTPSYHTVRRTRPTTVYPTTRPTRGETKPHYPTTPSYHTVRRTRPTTVYPTTRPTRGETKPHYPTTTVRRTRPPYTQTTEYSTSHTTRRRTPPHYTQTTHRVTRPHYTQTTEYTTSQHHETRPHYP